MIGCIYMYMLAMQGVDFIHCKYLINHVCGTPACDDIVVCRDKLDAIMIKVLICLSCVSALLRLPYIYALYILSVCRGTLDAIICQGIWAQGMERQA